MAVRLQVPDATKVTTLPLTVQMDAELVVAKTMGLGEPPPVALSTALATPATAGVTGAKPVMVCTVRAASKFMPPRTSRTVPEALLST